MHKDRHGSEFIPGKRKRRPDASRRIEESPLERPDFQDGDIGLKYEQEGGGGLP
jgi:hypothetical protein